MAETEPVVAECENDGAGDCHATNDKTDLCASDVVETCTETNDESTETGIKRKSEEMLGSETCEDETKKVKGDDESTTETAPTATEPSCPVAEEAETTESAKENGHAVHCDTECKDETEATLPEDIVVKTVEDVAKLCESGGDVEASS